MIGEYGYMEEGELGKAYNFRFLKRLASYAVPYKKTIIAALFISVLLTCSELAIPYLSKIAIDRFILSSWHRVDTLKLEVLNQDVFEGKYKDLLKNSSDNMLWYISNADMKKIDPADLHKMKSEKIIDPKRYYKTDPDVQLKAYFKSNGKEIVRMADGSVLIAYEFLDKLSKNEILRIRAGDITGVTMLAAVVIVLLLFSFALSYVEYYLLEYTGQHIMHDIRLQLFWKMQSYSVRFFERNPIGRLVTRVTNDIENLNEMFKSLSIAVVKDLFVLAGILLILLYLNLRLALVCFILIPFIFGLTFLFSKMAREAFRQLRSTVARINSFLQERISGMRVIQLFVREKYQMEVFEDINRDNYKAGMKQIKVFAIFMPIMELFSSFAIALLIWHGGAKVIGGELSLGTLVAFISYIQMFFKPIRDIAEKYNIMQSAMASTERIFEYMDLNEQMPEPESSIKHIIKKGHIVFDHVSFSYEKTSPVLKDISFEVAAGEKVAIVGATGSGKTTLVNLIERFYDPDRGAVLLDGIDLRKWSSGDLHRRLSICMQDVFIFAGNVADNISLGRDWITEEDIERAASQANALAFIQKFENGFQQKIGEGGATLSVGERQLLSFARALVSEPQILILDEATSSVDPETERLIQDAISRMAKKRTTLVVAHRLSTIRDADRILVMHKGSIREQGTHEELMAFDGIYYKLNKLKQG